MQSSVDNESPGQEAKNQNCNDDKFVKEKAVENEAKNDLSLSSNFSLARRYASLEIADLVAEVKERGILVPHDRQHFNWDCGIACARMILKLFGKNQNGTELSAYFTSAHLKTSIWTIDLAYLLTHFGIANRMKTLTLGVDANYSAIDFYASHLQEDDRRVDALFREAHLRGVSVVQEAVDMEEIVEHLAGGKRPVIVLIDWKKMGCLHCGRGGGGVISRMLSNVFGNDDDEEIDDDVNSKDGPKTKSNVGYQGHFIVLTAVDKEKNVIYFNNPSSSNPVCVTPIEDLEAARKSYGTDEDIIFVDDRPASTDIDL